MELLNQIEEEFDMLWGCESCLEADVVLWRGKSDKIKPKFSTKRTLVIKLIRNVLIIREW